MVVMESLVLRGAGRTAARCPRRELVDLRPLPSSIQAELLSPPKADLWVSGEPFHSTSAITSPFHHGEDAARDLWGTAAGARRAWAAEGWLARVRHCCARRAARGLRVSLADAACWL